MNCRFFFVNGGCWPHSVLQSMNQCAPVMMGLNEIGFIHFIDERSATSKDLTYFTANKKMIEDKRSDISTDPHLRCLV